MKFIPTLVVSNQAPSSLATLSFCGRGISLHYRPPVSSFGKCRKVTAQSDSDAPPPFDLPPRQKFEVTEVRRRSTEHVIYPSHARDILSRFPGFISNAVVTNNSFFIENIALNNRVTEKTLKISLEKSAAAFKQFGHQTIRNNYRVPPRPRGYALLLQLSRKRA